MKIISTKAHGVLDYLMGILLIASPWLFGFADGTIKQNLPVILGIVMLLMSACTNYELGMLKVINMGPHLLLDGLSGALLAASPWLFDFSDQVYLPHLILGLAEIGAAMLTDKIPYHKPHISATR